MKKNTKKLVLKKNTVQLLQQETNQQMVGGTGPTLRTTRIICDTFLI
ncbi:MAG: hypothetical protein JNM68_09215 [Dinghuibacter sp.]|nr:hypothetical protein [Dinghuibacter sp.]